MNIPGMESHQEPKMRYEAPSLIIKPHSAVGGRIKPSPESKFYDEPFALIDEIAGDVLGR